MQMYQNPAIAAYYAQMGAMPVDQPNPPPAKRAAYDKVEESEERDQTQRSL